MHVISTDFESASLRLPKHWLSFTSSFMLDALPFIQTLETTGKIPAFGGGMEDDLDNGNLDCPHCKKAFGTGKNALQQLRAHYAKNHFDKGERLQYAL